MEFLCLSALDSINVEDRFRINPLHAGWWRFQLKNPDFGIVVLVPVPLKPLALPPFTPLELVPLTPGTLMPLAPLALPPLTPLALMPLSLSPLAPLALLPLAPEIANTVSAINPLSAISTININPMNTSSKQMLGSVCQSLLWYS
jgi:hypothetical protein